jgi:hypothetical protein
MPRLLPFRLLPQAIVRLPRQSAGTLNPFSSRQAEIKFITFTATALQTWMTGPPTHPCAEITYTDFYNVLPISPMQIRICFAPIVGQPEDEGRCYCLVTAGQTSEQIAQVVVDSVRKWAGKWGRLFPGVRSTNARVVTPEHPLEGQCRIQVPFGISSVESQVTYSGPVGGSADAIVALTGVDVPLSQGLRGKPRHLTCCKDENVHPYAPG